jgi:anti-sigma factor RsiW
MCQIVIEGNLATKHKHIQKRLLLYLDDELAQREINKISAHLSECSSCYRRAELLKSLWKSDSVPARELPPPFLWAKLKNRIEQNSQSLQSVKNWSTGFVPLSVRIAAALAAILFGFYLASPTKGNQFSESSSLNELKAFAQECRLDMFDIAPSGTVGSGLFGKTDTHQ